MGAVTSDALRAMLDCTDQKLFRWVDVVKLPHNVPLVMDLLSHGPSSADALFVARFLQDIMHQFCRDWIEIVLWAEQARFTDSKYCGQLYQLLSIVLFQAGQKQLSIDVLAFAIGQHRQSLRAMLATKPTVRCIEPKQLFA